MLDGHLSGFLKGTDPSAAVSFLFFFDAQGTKNLHHSPVSLWSDRVFRRKKGHGGVHFQHPPLGVFIGGFEVLKSLQKTPLGGSWFMPLVPGGIGDCLSLQPGGAN